MDILSGTKLTIPLALNMVHEKLKRGPASVVVELEQLYIGLTVEYSTHKLT